MGRTSQLRRLTARGLLIVSVGVAAALLPAPPAHAATLNPGCSVLELWNAIVTANDETGHPGADTIQMGSACHLSISTSYPGTYFALPPITSAITIVGRSSDIRYSSVEHEHYGLFDVRAGAGLTLVGLDLVNGEGYTGGGYIHNAGDVLMNDVDIDGNDYFIASPAFLNEPSANLTFLDVTMQRVRGNSGLLRNNGSMYVVDSDLLNLNEIHGTANVGFIPRGRTVVNTGYMQFLNSRLTATRDIYAGDEQFVGGIENSGTLLLEKSDVSNVQDKAFGAAVYNSGSLEVRSSTFASNDSLLTAGQGGAVFNSGTASFVNSTFYANHAAEGGGIYNTGSTTVISSTVVGTEEFYSDPSTGAMAVQASILGACGGSVIDAGSNLVDYPALHCPGTTGSPLLVAWAGSYNGKGAVWRPGPGSDAADAIAGSCVATDQRGLPRPAGGACDIGAFENQVPSAPSALAVAAGSADPGNSRSLSLDWTDASDADHDSLTYRVLAQDADDAAPSQVGTASTSSATLSALGEGTYDFTVDASDSLYTSGTTSLHGVVVDLTAPTSPTATPDRSADFTAGDGTEWWADALDVSYSGSTDPTLADTSNGSGVAALTPTRSLTTSGAQLVTGTATDAAGNVSSSTSGTYRVDATAPVVSFSACPVTVLLKSSVQLAWTASDAHSGLATPSSGTLPVDTSTIGERTLNAGATDNVGHQSTATCVTKVIYDFTGYFNPVGSAFNKASAGKVVPVAFSLAGNQGVSIFAAGYPVSAPITCQSTAQLTTGAQTVTQTGLGYGGGRYSYPWRTQKSWSGTCRQFVMLLNDGTYHRANFSFK